MNEKINKNFFLSVVKDGVVIANYYSNSRSVIPSLKDKYKGCEVEVFDISKYGFSFGDAPVYKIHGGRLGRIECRETGHRWNSAKECCKEIGVPLKTLYTAIRRGSRIFGHHYKYADENYNQNGKKK